MVLTIREVINVALREHDTESGKFKCELFLRNELILTDVPADLAAYTEAMVAAVHEPAQVRRHLM